MQNYSKILYQGYKQFILNVNGKKVPIPYRINIPPDEHPRRQGKSSPEDILAQLKQDAKEQGFDLDSASVEEVKKFMEQNKLGIDCSGFAYRLLDFLTFETKGKHLTDFGLPNVGRTNVNILTSDEYSKPINSVILVQPGDLIKVDSSQKIPHCMVVLEKQPNEIIYVHSSRYPQTEDGVHTAKIEVIDPKKPLRVQKWQEDFLIENWQGNLGDGVKRFKKI